MPWMKRSVRRRRALRGSGVIRKSSRGEQHCRSGCRNEEVAHDGLLSLPLSPLKSSVDRLRGFCGPM
jgi:hypothetical protein